MPENTPSKLSGALEWLMESPLGYWLSTPSPGSNEHDDIWEDFELFSGDWVKILNRKEWYESPNVPSIYQDHIYIFDKNMDMDRPEETYYQQNVDSNEFRSEMDCSEELPSENGDLRISVQILTSNPPSGENDFCMVEYKVDTELKYEVPQGVTFLPRLLSKPLNQMFKVFFYQFLAEEMVEYDGEYALERTREYMQYLRKYHGEEPTQTKTRRSEYTPTVEEGRFFQ